MAKAKIDWTEHVEKARELLSMLTKMRKHEGQLDIDAVTDITGLALDHALLQVGRPGVSVLFLGMNLVEDER